MPKKPEEVISKLQNSSMILMPKAVWPLILLANISQLMGIDSQSQVPKCCPQSCKSFWEFANHLATYPDECQ